MIRIRKSGLDGQQVKAVHVKCDFDRGGGLWLGWSGLGCAHNLEITGTNPHITISLSGGSPHLLQLHASKEHDRNAEKIAKKRCIVKIDCSVNPKQSRNFKFG